MCSSDLEKAEPRVPFRALGDLRAFDFPMMTMEVSPNRQWLAASGLYFSNGVSVDAKVMLVDVASAAPARRRRTHRRAV